MNALARLSLVLSLAGLALAFLAPAAADAHERRAVGDYTFVVGFLKEPAFQDDTNGIDLRVTRGEQPVEGLETTLKADVVVGGQTMSVPLHPRFRQPGAYNGDFVPTREGTYVFRFMGAVDGQRVNETFESGPGRFNDVQAVAPLQFPDKVPSGIELQRAIQAAEGRASTATTLAIAGLLVGLAGLALAGWALVGRRGAPMASAAPAAGPPRATPAASQERL